MEPKIEEKDKKTKLHLNLVDWCVLVGVFVVIFSMCSPSLTLARQEQKISDMVERLQEVRSHILLYCAEHDGLMPGQQEPGRPVTHETFVVALCEFRPGDFSGISEIPENPYILAPELSAKVMCVNEPDAEPTGLEGVGWWFNAATGDFRACDSKFHTEY